MQKTCLGSTCGWGTLVVPRAGVGSHCLNGKSKMISRKSNLFLKIFIVITLKIPVEGDTNTEYPKFGFNRMVICLRGCKNHSNNKHICSIFSWHSSTRLLEYQTCSVSGLHRTPFTQVFVHIVRNP